MARSRRPKQPQQESDSALAAASAVSSENAKIHKISKAPGERKPATRLPVVSGSKPTESGANGSEMGAADSTARLISSTSTLTGGGAAINPTSTSAARGRPADSKKSRGRGSPQSKTAWMLRNTSDVVQQIDIPSIDPCTNKVTSDAGFELICTYNWIEQTKKKNNGQEIYVPGCPPKWLPHQLPVKLQPDQGAQYVDQNAYRLPQYPFEPIFWALDIMNPHARLNDVDIVCNRNSLRKLLDLASGRRPDPFVMHLHLLQETLFITRKERNARNMIRGGGQSGYGHNFEKAFTEADDDVHGSTSHHRVVSYDMGGLNCMVRFEVDAYYDEATDGVQDKTFDHTVLLEDAMQRLSLVGEPEPEPEPSFPFPTNRPKAFRKGVLLPSSAMAEIKTHGRRSKPLSQLLPQLWFGRTPHLLVGRHPAANGVFTEVEHTHAGSEFSAWEQENQAALRRLVGILKHLKEVVGGLQPAAAILLYQTKGGPLQVRRMKAPTEVLPECTRRYWSAN